VAVFPIDDPADPRITVYRNIQDATFPQRQQLFVAEGRLVVRRLLASSLVTRSVMVTRPALAALADAIPAGLPVFLVPQGVMNTVTGFGIHRGCLALGERGDPLDWRALAAIARRLVILERVGNADNVGAIFRNASAFGADAVLLGPDCADPLYRKAIRTSMAATLTVPFARVDPWPDAIDRLRAAGLYVIALATRPDADELRTVAARVPADGRVAIVAGHEADGLTTAASDACDTSARIPMAAGHDSLNVATAVGVALYELTHRPGIAQHT
jgi:tRNA G18 (ribose-2'-O)-methylase SpoU